MVLFRKILQTIKHKNLVALVGVVEQSIKEEKVGILLLESCQGG